MDVYGEQSRWGFSYEFFLALFDGWPGRHQRDLVSLNRDSVLWKAPFFIFFCPVFDNLRNMLLDYQRYSGWLWVIMFAIVLKEFKIEVIDI